MANAKENEMELVKPERWLWAYDKQLDRLQIIFAARPRGNVNAPCGFYAGPSWYGAKDCVGITQIEGRIPFSAEDVEAYETYFYSLHDLNDSLEQKYMLALNATAIGRFHRESLSSDRYFKATSLNVRPEKGELVTLVATFQRNGRNQEATFLIIDTMENECYAMLISNEAVQLDNFGGYLNVGSIVRVSNSRAIPIRCLNKELIQTLNIA